MTLWAIPFIGVPFCLALWSGVAIWRYKHRPLTMAESGAELAADLFIYQFNRFSKYSNYEWRLDKLHITVQWIERFEGPGYRRVIIKMDGVNLPTNRGAAGRVLAHLDAMESARIEEASAEAARRVARAVIDLQGAA